MGAVGGFAWAPLWVVPGGYLAATTVGGLAIGRGLGLRERLYLPAILPAMHLPWGWGFLTSPRKLARRVKASSVERQAGAHQM